MFSSRTQVFQDGRVIKTSISSHTASLRYVDVLNLLRTDAAFRSFYNQLLADAPFAAYFWEAPPLTRGNIDQPYEFALVDSPRLAGVGADAGAFADHFAAAGTNSVVVFPNMGHDALLVAPCPLGPREAYPHLAAFARLGPASQQQSFWQRVGEAVAGRLSESPLWLSTSGMGVYWLHARLDARPKYYTWKPYTVWEGRASGG